MKLFKLILFLLFTSIIKSQNIQTFYFVVSDKESIDVSTGFYPGKAFEFNYNRVNYDNKSFREIGLFDGDKKGVLFKIENKNWYIKRGKVWKIFYSPNKKINPTVKITGSWHQLKIKDYQTVNGISCIIYDVVFTNNIANGNIRYWFSPIYGIIQIKTDEVKLIRKDLIK